jgi:magnesium-transporting ATPase (P-type)
MGLNASVDDPILYAGSLISRGQCKALVCCVGKMSTRGIKAPKMPTDENTPLQNKLKNLTMQFTKMALIACLIVLVLSIVMIIVKMTNEVWWKVLISKSMKLINLIVVLFVVVLPEGLPLTVGVSLAFTTGKMFKTDRILDCELSEQTLDLIKESILFNCSARIEMDATTYVPVGDATEVGLLKFLQDADIPIHLLIQ